MGSIILICVYLHAFCMVLICVFKPMFYMRFFHIYGSMEIIKNENEKMRIIYKLKFLLKISTISLHILAGKYLYECHVL